MMGNDEIDYALGSPAYEAVIARVSAEPGQVEYDAGFDDARAGRPLGDDANDERKQGYADAFDCAEASRRWVLTLSGERGRCMWWSAAIGDWTCDRSIASEYAFGELDGHPMSEQGIWVGVQPQ
jgi:hypothetical protein